ncbi:MAG: hypothetical protein WCT08_05935 [Patescibacteria group bacterium]
MTCLREAASAKAGEVSGFRHSRTRLCRAIPESPTTRHRLLHLPHNQGFGSAPGSASVPLYPFHQR